MKSSASQRTSRCRGCSRSHRHAQHQRRRTGACPSGWRRAGSAPRRGRARCRAPRRGSTSRRGSSKKGRTLALVDRVVAELVDLLGAVAQLEAAPLAQVEVGREQLARRVAVPARAPEGCGGSWRRRGGERPLRRRARGRARRSSRSRPLLELAHARGGVSRPTARAAPAACGAAACEGERFADGAVGASSARRASAPGASLRLRFLGGGVVMRFSPRAASRRAGAARSAKSRTAPRATCTRAESPWRRGALRPSATQRKRRYLRNDGGASTSCATQPSAASVSAMGWGTGTATRPGQLDDRRERQHPVADDVERAGHVAKNGQLARRRWRRPRAGTARAGRSPSSWARACARGSA